MDDGKVSAPLGPSSRSSSSSAVPVSSSVGTVDASLALGRRVGVADRQTRLVRVRPFVRAVEPRQPARAVNGDRGEPADGVCRTRCPLDLLLGTVPRARAAPARSDRADQSGRRSMDWRHQNNSPCSGTSWPSARARSWLSSSSRSRISTRASGRNRPALHLAVRVEAVAERNVGPTVSLYALLIDLYMDRPHAINIGVLLHLRVVHQVVERRQTKAPPQHNFSSQLVEILAHPIKTGGIRGSRERIEDIRRSIPWVVSHSRSVLDRPQVMKTR